VAREQEVRTGSLHALLLAMLAVTAPHAQRLPGWVSAFVLALVAWRALIAWRGARLPSRWVLVVLAVVLSVGVIASYGPMLGRDASVALLAVMMGLKCLELRSLRDANVVLCLGYFLIITNFLYSQTMLTAGFMLVVLTWLTATTVALQDRARLLRPMQAAKMAGALVLFAAPVMLVLFVLFPRVQGPLFGFPQATSSGVTGLSDTMSPGDLSNLGLSDEVAFRVQFHGPAPKLSDLYWRGPVLWDFDGRTWRLGAGHPESGRFDATSDPLEYTVTLEPHHQRWLFAVDLPASRPTGSVLLGDFQMLAARPVRVRERYTITSHLRYRLGVAERPDVLRRALRLPAGYNPRSLQLAADLRARSPDDREVVTGALDLFRNQLFFYTLVPPELGQHSVDEFLFQTRRGFCEHYASAFVFLMRAAGVPARVVTGYQGGEMNPMGNYLLVRQSEAHAWAEVWLREAGWVRVDPTAAVSPARIQVGIAAAVPAGDPLPLALRADFAMLKRMRMTLDAVTNSWNQWVLGYTPDRQRRLFAGAGMGTPSWGDMVMLMLAVTGAVVAVIAALTLYRLRQTATDPAQALYRAFARKVARRGLTRAPSEGPRDFAARVGRSDPALAAAADRITQLYLALRYGAAPLAQLTALRALVRAFPRSGA
jgi:transglutaminase-like putative cysteine protease